MDRNSVCFEWQSPHITAGFETGVSLHSHTMHSRESLSFVPKYVHRYAAPSAMLKSIEDRYRRQLGVDLDYSRGYWTPPLPAGDAVQLEGRQIAVRGLKPLVSITDHDDLEACTRLQLVGVSAPWSVEWTTPFGSAVFHIGVHNLPPRDAHRWLRAMNEYTARPQDEVLLDMLSELGRIPDVLLVLNHPFSDEAGIGKQNHCAELLRFIESHANLVHALELNGLQSWDNNRDAIDLSRACNLPVISGGDRHGVEPNANINLTNATTLDEFIAEIRVDKKSNVLFMPQYRESLTIRYLENVWDILRDQPDLPGRCHWTDRVFFDHPRKGINPLSVLLADGPPSICATALRFVGFLMSLRLTFAPRGEISF